MKNTLFPIIAVAIATFAFSGCALISPKEQAVNDQSSSQTTSQSEQTVKITGSGSTYPLLQRLAAVYEAKNGKSAKINFLPPGESGSAINALKNNLVDLGGVARKLQPNEETGQIQYREIGRDILLVATHKSVARVNNLTTKDLKAIYSGALTNWKQLGGPDAPIIILDRPEDESAKKLLREYYLGQDLKNSPRAVVLKEEGELIKTLENTPYSIGAFSLGYAIANKLDVNRLSLDGIAPTTENMINSKYQMVRRLGIVWNKKPSPATQQFVDFISSVEGAKAMKEFGFAPSTPQK